MAAQEHSWLRVQVEVKPRTSFLAELVERLGAAQRLLTQTPPVGKMQLTEPRVKVGALGVGGKAGFTRASDAAQSVRPWRRPRAGPDTRRCPSRYPRRPHGRAPAATFLTGGPSSRSPACPACAIPAPRSHISNGESGTSSATLNPSRTTYGTQKVYIATLAQRASDNNAVRMPLGLSPQEGLTSQRGRSCGGDVTRPRARVQLRTGPIPAAYGMAVSVGAGASSRG